MPLKKVVVGTDFSDQANLAVDHAMAVARHSGAEIVFAHSMAVPAAAMIAPYPVAMPEADYAAGLKSMLEGGRTQLEELRERHKGQGVELSQVFVDDMPESGINKVADEQKADLIVVGSHGRTGASRFLLGSIAEQVVRHAKIDVLVARGDVPQGGYKKILVPTDFSDSATAALERAYEMVEPGGEIVLLHCWTLPGAGLTYWGPVGPELRKEIITATESYAAKFVPKHEKDTAKLSFRHLEREAKRGIQDVLEEGGFDLVVTGSHQRKGLNRWLLGSVAEATVRHSPCSVLVRKTATEG
jgi:nucleotide-binding universal stress UspA family protein